MPANVVLCGTWVWPLFSIESMDVTCDLGHEFEACSSLACAVSVDVVVCVYCLSKSDGDEFTTEAMKSPRVSGCMRVVRCDRSVSLLMGREMVEVVALVSEVRDELSPCPACEVSGCSAERDKVETDAVMFDEAVVSLDVTDVVEAGDCFHSSACLSVHDGDDEFAAAVEEHADMSAAMPDSTCCKETPHQWCVKSSAISGAFNAFKGDRFSRVCPASGRV